MATSPNDLVAQFHSTYGHPIRPTDSPTVDYSRVHMRYALIAEEFIELTEAIYGETPAAQIANGVDNITSIMRTRPETYNYCPKDVVETADALADLVYVIYGFALESGIPLDEVLQEVQRSNMSKLPPCEACDGRGFHEYDTAKEKPTRSVCYVCTGSTNGPPLRREDGKILKGARFSEPDIKKILFKGEQ